MKTKINTKTKTLTLWTLMAVFLLPSISYADTPKIQRYMTNPTQSDKARLKYMLWNVYDATLYTPNGQYEAQSPFALKLDYLIDLNGDDITAQSIKEMRQQGFADEEKLKKWNDAMKNIFPDVQKGDSILGVRDQQGRTIFYKNDIQIGKIDDPEFTQSFFNIWLGTDTSQPQLRQQLLGLK